MFGTNYKNFNITLLIKALNMLIKKYLPAQTRDTGRFRSEVERAFLKNWEFIFLRSDNTAKLN